MTWILFIFALIAGFIVANAFADFSVGILQGVVDDWDTTMYTIVADGKTYEHCRRVTKKRDGIKFTQGDDEFVFFGFSYNMRKEEENNV